MNSWDRTLVGCGTGSSGSRNGAGRAAISGTGSLGSHWSGRGSRVGSNRAVLATVVGYIEAGTLELESGSGQRAFQHTVTLGALKQRFCAKMLDFFKTVTTFSTSIRI